jgi:hypothetical protein
MLIKRDGDGKILTKKLDLSGTAYNLLEEYADGKNVFTWDYVMEQEAKATWPERYPDKPNPYADMPQMHFHTIDLAKAITKENIKLDKDYFSFREFFRPWQNDLSRDKQKIPNGCVVGDFVHADAVNKFLEMLTSDKNANYPYATEENLKRNAHSFWVIPGVKEGAALSKVLQAHPFFKSKNFGIVNVAGEGDPNDTRANYDALTKVRKAIEKHPYTITLSCGRLTTGVTVKEWSAVFMLSGSNETDAKGYMQTVFRAQSAGKINGVQKTDAHVYDFAPDRTLRVIAASILKSRYSAKEGMNAINEQVPEFEKFLEFCPVVAIDGAEFKPFSVQALTEQINRVQIDRALRTGFMDDGIYNESMILEMAQSDAKTMNKIFEKLKETSKMGQLTSAGVAKNKVKGDEGGKELRKSGGNKGKDKDKEQKINEKKHIEEVISRLRTISIRIPLLFFGGNFEIEDGKLSEIITGIDPASWDVFMPKGLSKDEFKELVKYYNQATVLGAGKIIRSKARAADELTPTERVIAITNLFAHFHNPAKETVLTPWRVVNMHLSDTLGGWCFYNEAFEEHDEEYYKRLLEPRWVDCGEVTQRTVNNPEATILELNSKTGLYPLYMTYNLYRAKLGEFKESEFYPEELNAYWDEAVKQVYVLCQSSMAQDITRRTLVGYRDVETNIKYDEKLLDNLRERMDVSVRRILKGSYWNKEGGIMKFDAIVGNPPYQAFLGGKSPLPIDHYFIEAAIKLSPNYVSMISPSRWFNTGTGLDDFRKERMKDKHIRVMHDFAEANLCFQNVDIKGGINYFLWDKTYEGDVSFTTHCVDKPIKTSIRPLFLEGMDVFIRNEELIPIYQKVQAKAEKTFDEILSSQDPFGFDTRLAGSQKRAPHQYSLKKVNETDVKFYSVNWRKEGVGYVPRKRVKENIDWIDKYKVLIPKAWGTGLPGKDRLNGFIVEPGSVCTETYIVMGPFETKAEAENALAYTKTIFFLAMVSMRKTTQNAAKGVYRSIPLQDFSKPWTDEELYKKYELTEKEIAFIESLIKPMD